MVTVRGDDLLDQLHAPPAAGQLWGPVVVDPVGPPPTGEDVAAVTSLPVVLIGPPDAAAWAPLLDVVAEDPPAVVAAVDAQPEAATTLALLLRGSERRTVAEGLVAESLAYSTLQAGRGFQRWLAARAVPSPRPEPERAVLVEHVADRLLVTLHRPHVHNAVNPAMRDELLDALAIAMADPSLHVELRGSGPSFCAGGDLATFGTFPDPAVAHLVRLDRSIGRALHRLTRRTTAIVHGACYGSGIELPAFAGRVVAADDVRIALPELSLGLIPGAGGTVSLTRRIGRHRTAWLALTGAAIDAATALEWGLVDEVRRGATLSR